MASIDLSTSSSQISAVACEEHKRSVDEAFLSKMKGLVERLRNENATLQQSLDIERSGVRALKAQHDSSLRSVKTEYKKKEELLEKQLRMITKSEKICDDTAVGNKIAELKKLSTETQSLKAANRVLQSKLKVAQAAECARAAELRAQSVKYAALERAAYKDAKAQCHKLLEEIKSKERLIVQLQREAARAASQDDQAQRMEGRATELSRQVRLDQGKEKSNRENLNTGIQHRKETYYREAPPSDEDSAVSSAPPSLSPQPLNDMWACSQCRAAEERAATATRECGRLTDALRDARDQLELMEFRLLELEDAQPDKTSRDNLTDTDSGCVSPGSRIKDSASPELKRMDSGYKSPPAPGSPSHPRRNMNTPSHDEFREEFAKAQVLADILDRNSETSDSLRSNPVKEHLEQMILNAESVEDRSCLEQVLMLLYNYQALSSSVSEDDYQIKPKRFNELKTPKIDSDIPSLKHKAVATVTPYSQQHRSFTSESLESLCNEERKPNNVLQESGIFEEAETESIGTQTEVNDSFECSSELNTEIQRLNSIREKLQKQGRNRTLGGNEGEGLECRCVKLGKKHKQYYERRLKFLEGKISIYEAAQDVKKSKLAERLQKEFILENRIQELESQLSELQDKYERLEEECCELEEIENDTRLHWQQLEIDYELCTAQLRDMTEQRECSRAQAERMISDLNKNNKLLKSREEELQKNLSSLEKAVPALIAWNMVQVINAKMSPNYKHTIMSRIGPFDEHTKKIIAKCSKKQRHLELESQAIEEENSTETQILKLLVEKKNIQEQSAAIKKSMEAKVKEMEDKVELLKRQLAAAELAAQRKDDDIEQRIVELERLNRDELISQRLPIDMFTRHELEELRRRDEEAKTRISELEKRESAYLEMLTQADDMWAEMEGGYKKKIEESQQTELKLKAKVVKLKAERDDMKNSIIPLNNKIQDAEEVISDLRISLDKAERDKTNMKAENQNLSTINEKANIEISKSESNLVELRSKFQAEVNKLRKLNKQLSDNLDTTKENAKKAEKEYHVDFDAVKKQLNRSIKDCQELEVTNSELKEEVESLEKQLALTQKSLSQCKRKCDEKIKTLSHELSIKTEELEELRSEMMRQSLHNSRLELKPDRTEYIDEGYTICTAVPKKIDYGSKMHHSMGFITSDSRCSCPSLRSHLVGQLIEDLFDRIHSTVDDDLTRLCKDIVSSSGRVDITAETKAKITNYLLMAISKELVRSIGDADAKTDTEEWQRAVSSMTYTSNFTSSSARGEFSSLRLEGNAGVLSGASRLASVSCACAAARLCAAAPDLADDVKICQEEVLDHSDVKVMEEQLANAIESIVNCPSCALGTNVIVWSTDV